MKSSTSKRIRYYFRTTLVALTSFAMVFQSPMTASLLAQSPAIVPDGRTATTVTSNPGGTLTDVRTNTVSGINAYNSFSRFNVPTGNTTNLHVPDAARNLINLVHAERSQIDGVLNSYKNGQIGGNVYFLNPHGIVIGKGGTVNVGSLNLQTPTSQYMNELLKENGQISAVHERMLFDGTVPISPSGVISVKGKVNAVEEVQIKAGTVDVAQGASIRAGRQVQVEFGDVVNTGKLELGNELLVTPEGKIKIVASGDVSVAGRVSADAVAGEKAGDVEVKSGNDITVEKGAEITAKGADTNSDGGNVVIFADNNAYLKDGGVVDVSAQDGTGGFLEFSAVKKVDMVGNGLRSSAGGTVLIDPEDIVWSGDGNDVYTYGANYELDAGRVTGSISLSNIVISTRQVNDRFLTGEAKRNTHKNDVSTGNSGNITLKAEKIDLSNVYFLTFATGDYDAGSIGIFKYDTGVHTRDPMTWNNVYFYAHSENGKAGDIGISAISEKLHITGSRFDNEAKGIGKELQSGSLRFGELSSVNDKELGEGGTFSFNGVNIKTGDFLVKGAHPDGSDMTNSVEGKVTLDWTNILANRIYVESEEDITISNFTTLKTRKVYTKNSADDAADIILNLVRNDGANVFDIVAKRTSTIKIDGSSTLEGNDILIQSVVTAGRHLEGIELKDEDGKVIGYKIINDEGDEIDAAEIDDGGLGDTIIGLFENTLPDLLKRFEMPVLASFRGFDIGSHIEIDGKLYAENSIEISSTAAASSSAMDFGIAGFAFNVAVLLPESKITIGEKAELKVTQGDILIESIVFEDTVQSTFNLVPVNKVPFGFVTGIAVTVAKNEIVVKDEAVLEALNGYIDITAVTDRSLSISATGGKGNDWFAAVLTFAYQEVDTHVTIGGDLIALGADVTATTYVEENTLSAKTVLGEGWLAGAINSVDYFAPVISAIKAGAFGLINKIKPSMELGKNPDELREFGMGLAAAIMVDNIDTSAIISGTANITVRDYLNLEALTHNVPVAVASTTINPFVLNEGEEKSEKETAIAGSAPVLVILQNSTAEIQDGATIYSGRQTTDKTRPSGVNVNAVTELPYNLDHLLAKIVLSIVGDDRGYDGVGDVVPDLVSMLLSNNLGLDSGLFNTWSQTSIESEETAVGIMLSVVYTDIESVARVGDNVTIAGLSADNQFGADYGNIRPDLSVTALTDVQMGYVTGNMRSFLKTLPNAKAPGVATAPLNFSSLSKFTDSYKARMGGVSADKKTKAKQSFSDSFQSMWGSQSAKGVGAGVMFNWLDNSAIAEIGGATLSVNDLDVSAETKGFNLMLSVGAGSTEDFGLMGTLGVTVANIESYAKIDDAAKINAARYLSIDAKDRTVIVGFGGNLSTGDGNAFGLTAVAPIVLRDVRAVWGNYLDEGDDAVAETTAVSEVGGDVKVHAEALGVTATMTVSGVGTSSSQTDKKMQELDTTYKDVFAAFQLEKKFGNLTDKSKGEIQSFLNNLQSESTNTRKNTTNIGMSGSVGLNLLMEEVYAGIGGNVNITARSFDIVAENKVIDASIVGSVVAQLGKNESKNVGVAGAIGANVLIGDTIAFVGNSDNTRSGATTTLTYSDTFKLNAERGGYIGALTAGAAGSSGSKGFEAAGSLSFALVMSETSADIVNATVTKSATSTKGDMNIGAANEALVVNIAGGLAIGGKAAVGISIAGTVVTQDTSTAIVDSVIDANNMTNKATTESLLITLALAGGVTTEGSAGIGGTLAFALSDGDTSVTVSGSTIDLTGTLTMASLSDCFGGTDGTYDDLIAAVTDAENEQEEDEDNENYEKSGFFSDKGKVDINKSDEDGNTSTEQKSVKLGLSNKSPRIVTAALAVGGSDKVGIGANIGVNMITEENFVYIGNSTITSGSAGIEAKTEGGMIAVGLGVAGGGKAGISGNFGVNLVGGRTEVVFNKGTLDADNIAINAESAAGITNLSVVVAAGGTAGVGVGFSYNMVAHSIAVDVKNESELISGGDIAINAENNADMISFLINVSAGGTAGVGVSLAINTIGTIQLDDADLETPEDTKDQKEEKEDELAKILESVGQDVTDDDNPFQVIFNARNRTTINVVDSEITAEDDVTLDAFSGGGMISGSVAVGAAGTAGVGVAAAYNSISGSVGVFGYDSDITATNGNLITSSQIANAMYSVVIGGGVGGTAGVAVSVDANVLKATNKIDFSNESNLNAGKDLVLKATNTGEVVGSSAALAGGQYAAVAAALTVNVLKGETGLSLNDTELISGGSIVLDAETINDMYGVTAAFALSISATGAASVGATIAVNDLKGTASIDIVDCVLRADDNVLVHSNVDGHLVAVSGSVSLMGGMGGAAVAGSVIYNGIHAGNTINITDSTIDGFAKGTATFSDLATTYELGGVFIPVDKADSLKNESLVGDFDAFEGRRGVGIGAYTHSDLENYFFQLSVAITLGAAVNVGVPVNEIGGTTTINLDSVDINLTGGAASVQDTVIEALMKTESIGVVAGISGSLVAANAFVDMHLLNSLVETKITASDIEALQDILIGARNSDDTDTYLIGVAIGGVALPVNAEGIIAKTIVRTVIDAGDKNVLIDAGGNLDIYAHGKLDIKEVNISVGGGVVAGGAAFTINNLQQKASVEISGDYDLKAGKTLDITAKGETVFEEQIDAFAAGLGAVSGAMGIAYSTSLTEVVFNSRDGLCPSLKGKEIVILAKDIFIQKPSQVGGFAVGSVGAAGGLNILVLKNGAVVRGVVDMDETDSIDVDALLVRDVDVLSMAGAATIGVGLAGTLNRLEIGFAAEESREGMEDTMKELADFDFGDSETERTKTVFDDLKGAAGGSQAGQRQSAAVLLGGNLEANTVNIDATVDNNIRVVAAGIGVGAAVGAGGALLYVEVEDTITANFTGAVTADSFTLQGRSVNKGTTEAIAGGGGFLGLAAAGNVTTFTADIETALGEGSTVDADVVELLSKQEFGSITAKADSGAIGMIGAGGSDLTLTLDGNSVVKINDNAKIYSPTITIAATKNYSDINADTMALAGGLASGGGLTSRLNLDGFAEVDIYDGVILWNSRTDNPGEDDTVTINAEVNATDVLNSGAVKMGALIAAAFGNTDTAMTFDNLVGIDKADIRSGDVSLKTKRNLVDVATRHETTTGGAVVIAGGNSSNTLGGRNDIVLKGTAVDAWGTLSLTSGSGSNALESQTYVYNGGIIPGSSSATTSAETTVDVVNEISLTGTDLKSVKNILMYTNLENFDDNVAYAETDYMYDGGYVGFVDPSKFSIKEMSGSLSTTVNRNIKLHENNTFEAGSHYNTWVTIDPKDGGIEIKASPWLNVDHVTDTGVSMYDILMAQIKALEEKKALADYSTVDSSAYQIEIEQLEAELKNYVSDPAGDLTDPDNYFSINIVEFAGNITAASGNIVLYGEIVNTGTGNKMTAHGDPKIDIKNNSSYSLRLGEISLVIDDPVEGGGRLLLDGKNADKLDGVALDIALVQDDPLISVVNVLGGENGQPAPELFLTSKALLKNSTGLVKLDSKGTIWDNSEINAKDVSIATKGSYYRGYSEGRFDVGGNPYNDEKLQEAVTKFLNTYMIGGNDALSIDEVKNILDKLQEDFEKVMKNAKLSGGYSDANYTKLQDTLDNLIVEENKTLAGLQEEILGMLKATFMGDLSGQYVIIDEEKDDYGNTEKITTLDVAKLKQNNITLEAMIPGINAKITAYEASYNDLLKYETATKTAASLHEQIPAMQALAEAGADLKLTTAYLNYNNAVMALQNACTAESWVKLFDNIGDETTADLVSKNGGEADATLVNDYKNAKDAYERTLGIAARNYIAKKVKNYDDARSSSKYENMKDSSYAKSQISGKALVGEYVLGADEIPDVAAGANIHAERSVFISAETLNINGTIHSGTLEKNYTIDSGNLNKAGEVWKFDSSTGTIVLDDIIAYGGNITLYGNIISTGNGKLHVEDGFGNITITNNTGYDLQLGRVDTGLGAEGTITIYDTSKGTDGKPQKTLYTRVDNNYYVQVDDGNRQSIDNASELVYSPMENRWLKNIVQSESTMTWKYTYVKDMPYGSDADWLIKDDEKGITGVSGTATVVKSQQTGTYLVVDPNLESNETLYATYKRDAGKVNESVTSKLKKKTLHREYTYNYTTKQSYTETVTTYLNASRPIEIFFSGNETAGNVEINGKGNGNTITLGGLVRAGGNTGIVKVNNINGTIVSKDVSGVVNAKNIILDSNAGTSANNRLNVEALHNGTNFTGNGGHDYYVSSTRGPLVLGENGTSFKVGAFDIVSTGSVSLADGSTGLSATGRVSIVSQYGTMLGENGTAFLITGATSVNLKAAGDIRLDYNGDSLTDLYVEQIASTGGDVVIDCLSGSIFDFNPAERPDPRSDEQRKELWAELGLLDGSDEFKQVEADRVDAYEREMTQLYFEAWRSVGFDADKYDSNYEFAFDDTQRKILVDSGWDDDRIAAEEGKRTRVYHEAFDSDYDTKFFYTATAEEKLAMQGKGWTQEQLDNALNIPLFILSQDAGNRRNTTSMIEEPNIVGRKVTIFALDGIGGEITDSHGAEITINKSDLIENILNDDVVRRAVADAEWDDVTFGETSITIKRYDDLDVDTGLLSTWTKNGSTFLGAQNDVVVETIVSGLNGSQALRFKTDGNLLGLAGISGYHIKATNAVLESGNAQIGTDAENPLYVNLTGSDADRWITARGATGVYISFRNDTVSVREVSSGGDVYLQAGALRYAKVKENHTVDFVVLSGRDIILDSASVGTADDAFLLTQLGGGSLTLFSGTHYIGSPRGGLNVILQGTMNLDIDVATDLTVDANGNSISGLESSVGKNLSIANGVIDKDFTANVLGSLKLSDIVASDDSNITLGAADGKIELLNITGTAGWIRAIAYGDMRLENVILVADGIDLNSATADLLVTDSSLKARELKLSAANKLTLSGFVASVGNLLGTSGDDLSLENVRLTVSGNSILKSFQDITLDDSSITGTGSLAIIAGENFTFTTSTASHKIDLGGDIAIDVRRDISLTDMKLAAGANLLIDNGGNLILSHTDIFGDNVNLGSTGDQLVDNSTVTATGELTMNAEGTQTVTETNLSGDNVNLGSTGDQLVDNSTVTATGELTMTAEGAQTVDHSNLSGNNVNLSTDDKMTVTDSIVSAVETLYLQSVTDMLLNDSTLSGEAARIGVDNGPLLVTGVEGRFENMEMAVGDDIYVDIYSVFDLAGNIPNSFGNTLNIQAGGPVVAPLDAFLIQNGTKFSDPPIRFIPDRSGIFDSLLALTQSELMHLRRDAEDGKRKKALIRYLDATGQLIDGHWLNPDSILSPWGNADEEQEPAIVPIDEADTKEPTGIRTVQLNRMR